MVQVDAWIIERVSDGHPEPPTRAEPAQNARCKCPALSISTTKEHLMKHQNRTRAVDTFPAVSVGQKIHLNLDTPDGLFEANNRNKYIVTRDHNTEVAVVLVHNVRPPFTWRRLRRRPSELGRWRGPYALRLTHALGDGIFPLTPGSISISGCYAGVDCRERDGSVGCVALGGVGDAGATIRHSGRVLRIPTPDGRSYWKTRPTWSQRASWMR